MSKTSTTSSIHGVRYIFTSSHSKVTRFFWTFAFLSSICGFIFYLQSSYTKTFINPDFATRVKQKLSRDIPFPAVTLCSPLFARDKKADIRNYFKVVFNSESRSANLSKEECEYFSASAHWCFDNYAQYSTCDDDPNKIVEFLEKGSLRTEEFLISCTFNLKFRDCVEIFTKMLIGYGVCYTYNMQGLDLILSDKISEDFNVDKFNSGTSFWSFDTGYKISKEEIFPVRALNFHDVRFVGNLKNIDAENFCDFKAVIVTFHPPNEIPSKFHDVEVIPYGKMKIFDLTAKSFSAEKDLRKFKPKFRKCYFEGEKNLKFFKSYTKNHCELECMSNYTLKTCGCVKYSMPRENSTKICRLRDAACYYKITSRYPNIGNEIVSCDCFSTCNDIKYSVKSTSESTFDDLSELSHLDLNASEIVIFRGDFIFTENTIEEYESFVAYKLQNFIADFGGLLGLFMGCSVLSIIEIFYVVINWNADKLIKKSNLINNCEIVEIKRGKNFVSIPPGCFEYRE